jgi:hypothetical protein
MGYYKNQLIEEQSDAEGYVAPKPASEHVALQQFVTRRQLRELDRIERAERFTLQRFLVGALVFMFLLTGLVIWAAL